MEDDAECGAILVRAGTVGDNYHDIWDTRVKVAYLLNSKDCGNAKLPTQMRSATKIERCVEFAQDYRDELTARASRSRRSHRGAVQEWLDSAEQVGVLPSVLDRSFPATLLPKPGFFSPRESTEQTAERALLIRIIDAYSSAFNQSQVAGHAWDGNTVTAAIAGIATQLWNDVPVPTLDELSALAYKVWNDRKGTVVQRTIVVCMIRKVIAVMKSLGAEGSYDTVDGSPTPVATPDEPEAPMYDEETGLPLRGFNPETGEPLVPTFDPDTGLPLAAQPEQEQHILDAEHLGPESEKALFVFTVFNTQRSERPSCDSNAVCVSLQPPQWPGEPSPPNTALGVAQRLTAVAAAGDSSLVAAALPMAAQCYVPRLAPRGPGDKYGSVDFRTDVYSMLEIGDYADPRADDLIAAAARAWLEDHATRTPEGATERACEGLHRTYKAAVADIVHYLNQGLLLTVEGMEKWFAERAALLGSQHATDAEAVLLTAAKASSSILAAAYFLTSIKNELLGARAIFAVGDDDTVIEWDDQDQVTSTDLTWTVRQIEWGRVEVSIGAPIRRDFSASAEEKGESGDDEPSVYSPRKAKQPPRLGSVIESKEMWFYPSDRPLTYEADIWDLGDGAHDRQVIDSLANKGWVYRREGDIEKLRATRRELKQTLDYTDARLYELVFPYKVKDRWAIFAQESRGDYKWYNYITDAELSGAGIPTLRKRYTISAARPYEVDSALNQVLHRWGTLRLGNSPPDPASFFKRTPVRLQAALRKFCFESLSNGDQTWSAAQDSQDNWAIRLLDADAAESEAHREFVKAIDVKNECAIGKSYFSPLVESVGQKSSSPMLNVRLKGNAYSSVLQECAGWGYQDGGVNAIEAVFLKGMLSVVEHVLLRAGAGGRALVATDQTEQYKLTQKLARSDRSDAREYFTRRGGVSVISANTTLEELREQGQVQQKKDAEDRKSQARKSLLRKAAAIDEEKRVRRLAVAGERDRQRVDERERRALDRRHKDVAHEVGRMESAELKRQTRSLEAQGSVESKYARMTNAREASLLSTASSVDSFFKELVNSLIGVRATETTDRSYEASHEKRIIRELDKKHAETAGTGEPVLAASASIPAERAEESNPFFGSHWTQEPNEQDYSKEADVKRLVISKMGSTRTDDAVVRDVIEDLKEEEQAMTVAAEAEWKLIVEAIQRGVIDREGFSMGGGRGLFELADDGRAMERGKGPGGLYTAVQQRELGVDEKGAYVEQGAVDCFIKWLEFAGKKEERELEEGERVSVKRGADYEWASVRVGSSGNKTVEYEDDGEIGPLNLRDISWHATKWQDDFRKALLLGAFGKGGPTREQRALLEARIGEPCLKNDPLGIQGHLGPEGSHTEYTMPRKRSLKEKALAVLSGKGSDMEVGDSIAVPLGEEGRVMEECVDWHLERLQGALPENWGSISDRSRSEKIAMYKELRSLQLLYRKRSLAFLKDWWKNKEQSDYVETQTGQLFVDQDNYREAKDAITMLFAAVGAVRSGKKGLDSAGLACHTLTKELEGLYDIINMAQSRPIKVDQMLLSIGDPDDYMRDSPQAMYFKLDVWVPDFGERNFTTASEVIGRAWKCFTNALGDKFDNALTGQGDPLLLAQLRSVSAICPGDDEPPAMNLGGKGALSLLKSLQRGAPTAKEDTLFNCESLAKCRAEYRPTVLGEQKSAYMWDFDKKEAEVKQTAFQVGLDQQLYRVAFGQFVKGMVYNLLELRDDGLDGNAGIWSAGPHEVLVTGPDRPPAYDDI